MFNYIYYGYIFYRYYWVVSYSLATVWRVGNKTTKYLFKNSVKEQNIHEWELL